MKKSAFLAGLLALLIGFSIDSGAFAQGFGKLGGSGFAGPRIGGGKFGRFGGRGGVGFGGFGGTTFSTIWDLYLRGDIPIPPYFALHPPVYYSYPVPRTYGYSPFAYPGHVRTPDVTMHEEPTTIVNPYVPSSQTKKNTSESKDAPADRADPPHPAGAVGDLQSVLRRPLTTGFCRTLAGARHYSRRAASRMAEGYGLRAVG